MLITAYLLKTMLGLSLNS